MEIKATDIKIVNVDSIIPNPKNPNKHEKNQIERLCKLIKNTGFRNPLVISNKTGFLVVGHGRLEAAKALKMDSVPVIFQDFKNEADEYAYMTADNAIGSWSELDLEIIKDEILNFDDFDIELLGLNSLEIIEPEEVDLPELSDKDPECQQVTFVLSNEQKDLLDEAIEKAKKEEDCTDEINQNSNGNALAALLRRYVHG